MILADTSVWIDHFHQEIESLTLSLENSRIIVHPFVVGEIAVGRLRHRRAVLSDLAMLKVAVVADDAEVLTLIDRHRLFGSGIGYIDAHLLASVLITPDARLWTRDRRLKAAALSMDVAAMET